MMKNTNYLKEELISRKDTVAHQRTKLKYCDKDI